MKGARLLILVPVLLALISLPTAAAPLHSAPLRDFVAGPCAPGVAYDPACDVNHDNQITITDIQLTAGHWNQSGTWVSDNLHNYLGQEWTGTNNPLKLTGSYGTPDYAPLVVSNSGGNGVSVSSAGWDGVYVSSAGHDGVFVSSAGWDGVYVYSADLFGVNVHSAGLHGVYVDAAGADGFYVRYAGAPSTSVYSSASNGFAVAGAQGNGLYVGRADLDGVYVNSTAWHGVNVIGAGVNGVYATANNNGVDANTTKTNGEWGLYTPDKIRGSNITLSSVTIIAQVVGEHALTFGDLVAAVGVADPLPDSTVPLALVRLADASIANGIVGVVEGRMALTPKPQHEDEQQQEPALDLRSAEGPAQAGDYVAITVLGVARVKVAPGESAISAGTRLTAAANGTVRPLQTRTVDGMIVTEGAPVIGAALEAAKDGMVWVLVNPQ